jgi:rhamnose transport system ATP-binding protein
MQGKRLATNDTVRYCFDFRRSPKSTATHLRLSMNSPLLQLKSVAKSFGAVRALKGVSFDLQAGEVHALLGENGAGKSTLIKIITGAHQPDGGSISIDSKEVSSLTPGTSHQLGIACIYQQPALFPDLSVAENIGLRLEQYRPFARIDWSYLRDRAKELLDRIGADIDVKAEVRTLSMPQQQLVEIACAIGAGARIVIMDEPTASLTQKEQHLLFTVVRELRQTGVGVIYISHRLDEIFELADRVTVLRDGESVGTRSVHSRTLQTDGVQDERLTESQLIQMMVGRDVSSIFPPGQSDPGEVVLSLRKLGCTSNCVKNITLDVRAGEIVGLAGLVGAGRTELARVLFGLTPADSGEILLNGQSTVIRSPQDAVAQGIAYVPEDRRRHGVILDMPIAHNITMAIHRLIFPASLLRLEKEKRLTEHYIQELAIKAFGPMAPGNSLSGGNQQKVALARWLATKPKLLILDEPTQGVDVGAKSEIHKIIRCLAHEGLAVIMISSDLPEVIGMSDRIAVLRGGEIASMLPGRSDAQLIMSAALGQTESKPLDRSAAHFGVTS